MEDQATRPEPKSPLVLRTVILRWGMGDSVVRWKVEPLKRSRRGLDERLLLWAPRAARVLGRFLAGRRASSRSRQALIRRVIRVGFAANNRLDYDAMCVFYDPAVEIRLMGGATRIDLDPLTRAH
jgi:hypothetical protein